MNRLETFFDAADLDPSVGGRLLSVGRRREHIFLRSGLSGETT